jgi:hypothetical protein
VTFFYACSAIEILLLHQISEPGFITVSGIKIAARMLIAKVITVMKMPVNRQKSWQMIGGHPHECAGLVASGL